MTMENQTGNTTENSEHQLNKSILKEENKVFLILEEKIVGGIKLNETEQARFEELNKIRADRDKKYSVNQEPELFANEGKQVIVPRTQN